MARPGAHGRLRGQELDSWGSGGRDGPLSLAVTSLAWPRPQCSPGPGRCRSCRGGGAQLPARTDQGTSAFSPEASSQQHQQEVREDPEPGPEGPEGTEGGPEGREGGPEGPGRIGRTYGRTRKEVQKDPEGPRRRYGKTQEDPEGGQKGPGRRSRRIQREPEGGMLRPRRTRKEVRKDPEGPGRRSGRKGQEGTGSVVWSRLKTTIEMTVR